jgi:starch synthase (maltosyl-transferring)
MTRNGPNTRSRRKENPGTAFRTRKPPAESASSSLTEPRIRAVIEGVKPEIDCGRFPIKRVVGDRVIVEADIFTDGHDALSARLLFRAQGDADWREAPMEALVNDRWRGAFNIMALTDYFYTLEAWVDRFKSWRDGLSKKAAAKQDVGLELIEGAELIALAAKRARGSDAETLGSYAAALRAKESGAVQQALEEELAALMSKHAERRWAERYDK